MLGKIRPLNVADTYQRMVEILAEGGVPIKVRSDRSTFVAIVALPDDLREELIGLGVKTTEEIRLAPS